MTPWHQATKACSMLKSASSAAVDAAQPAISIRMGAKQNNSTVGAGLKSVSEKLVSRKGSLKGVCSKKRAASQCCFAGTPV